MRASSISWFAAAVRCASIAASLASIWAFSRGGSGLRGRQIVRARFGIVGSDLGHLRWKRLARIDLCSQLHLLSYVNVGKVFFEDLKQYPQSFQIRHRKSIGSRLNRLSNRHLPCEYRATDRTDQRNMQRLFSCTMQFPNVFRSES